MSLDRLALPLVVTATVVLAFGLQGARGIWEPDEGRYSAVAMEMLRTGDLVHPSLSHEMPHYTKPPVTYWALAASIGTLGRHEAAARLPNGLAYLATVLLVLAIARRLGVEPSWFPPLVYATSLLPVVAVNVVTTDTLLTFWETLAMTAFVYGWWQPASKASRGWMLLMWIAFAVAFLTKGPPGLLPLAAILAFVGWREGRDGLVRAFPWTGVLLFLALGLSWYVVVAVKRPDLIHSFLSHEVLDRIASPRHDRHSQWYGALRVYVPVLLAGTLPWTLLFLRALKKAPSYLRPSTWRERAQRDPAGLFLLLWFLLPFAVFVVVRSRLELYLLPLFVPLALLLARQAGDRVRADVPGATAIGLWIAMMLSLRWAAGVVPVGRDARPLASHLAALGAGEANEIVLVDHRPLYALDFYLGVEVEGVSVSAPEDSQSARPPQALDEELRESEPDHRVWLVPEEREQAFLEHLQARSPHPLFLGRWEDLVLYESRPEDPRDDPVERPGTAPSPGSPSGPPPGALAPGG